MEVKLHMRLERDLDSLLKTVFCLFVCLFTLTSDRIVAKGEGRAHRDPEQWQEGAAPHFLPHVTEDL